MTCTTRHAINACREKGIVTFLGVSFDDRSERKAVGKASAATLPARFESKVDRSGDCHLWTSSVDGYGYGRINLDGRPVGTHVVAWFLATGEWPPDCVLHHCDNPPCVRFEHLFLGSRANNADDMSRKGRHPNQRKTVCPKQHPLTGDNLYIEPSTGRRRCKKCLADRQRARNSKE